MDTIVEHESQTTLSQLLDRVSRGERITITENGLPVAVLQSPEAQAMQSARNAVREMQDFERYNLTLGDITLREAIEEGRP